MLKSQKLDRTKSGGVNDNLFESAIHDKCHDSRQLMTIQSPTAQCLENAQGDKAYDEACDIDHTDVAPRGISHSAVCVKLLC